MPPTINIHKLYAKVFALPQLRSEPVGLCLFVDEDGNLLSVSTKDFVYIKDENPMLFALRVLEDLFPKMQIIQVAPVAISPDGYVVMFAQLRKSEVEMYGKVTNMDSSMSEVYGLCKEKILTRNHPFPSREIESANELGWRLSFHRNVIKRLIFPFSNLIIQNRVWRSIEQFARPRPQLICDVGCGHDHLVIDIAKQHGAIALLNDPVSKVVRQTFRESPYSQVILSNENALELRLAKKADFLVCKNILHHMNSEAEIEELLKHIFDLAEKIIVVEPEDPVTSLLGFIWNWYYRKFLKDQGENFLAPKRLQELLVKCFPNKQISCEKIWTIKGNFMFALIT